MRCAHSTRRFWTSGSLEPLISSRATQRMAKFLLHRRMDRAYGLRNTPGVHCPTLAQLPRPRKQAVAQDMANRPPRVRQGLAEFRESGRVCVEAEMRTIRKPCREETKMACRAPCDRPVRLEKGIVNRLVPSEGEWRYRAYCGTGRSFPILTWMHLAAGGTLNVDCNCRLPNWRRCSFGGAAQEGRSLRGFRLGHAHCLCEDTVSVPLPPWLHLDATLASPYGASRTLTSRGLCSCSYQAPRRFHK